MYALGVDLGTTFTAAAVRRDGRTEVAGLGTRSTVIPSVVLLRTDGVVLTGDAAQRRSMIEPQRVAREFKRRFGDPTPILLAGSPWSPQALTARLLRAVVDHVSAREGTLPQALCVCHPANWGPYTTDLLQQAVRLADLPALPDGRPVSVRYVTEPEAAAAFYAQQQRIETGDVVAVYDLGGGTFDSAVLRKTSQGFAILGEPEGVEHLGGVDIDAAVFAHVTEALNGALEDLDEDNPEVLAAVARLREECTQAKEALSADTDVTIPVLLPGLTSEVRLTRRELETMIRPAIQDSIEALRRALRSAGVTPDELHSVLLVGGSSRIPLVAEMVSGELGRPVAVDADPKNAVAVGAASLAAQAITDTVVLPVTPPAVPIVAQPLAERPAAAEPHAAQPVAAEHFAPEPVADEPVATEPVSEPATGPVSEPVSAWAGAEPNDDRTMLLPIEQPPAEPTVQPAPAPWMRPTSPSTPPPGSMTVWSGGRQVTPPPVWPVAQPKHAWAAQPPPDEGRASAWGVGGSMLRRRKPVLAAAATLVAILATAGAALALRDDGRGGGPDESPRTGVVSQTKTDKPATTPPTQAPSDDTGYQQPGAGTGPTGAPADERNDDAGEDRDRGNQGGQQTTRPPTRTTTTTRPPTKTTTPPPTTTTTPPPTTTTPVEPEASPKSTATTNSTLQSKAPPEPANP